MPMCFEQATVSPTASSLSLSVPASPDHLWMLRSMVRTVVSRHPLSRDALDDLVLAVDEAAAILVNHARSASAVVCVVDSGPGSLRVYLTATTHAPVDALSSSFGWFVLAALVDNATLDQKPARPSAANELSVTISVEKAFPSGG
ncbi:MULTISPECIES: ATP-binding protein [Rhodococcus]|uniref:ATP-binding protein n=1 Tax=Rhodococcus qingshengii JCM 15477 TaxID=1303681 RepID=A0AB38RMX1_RHOSG|nr:MULTISPECIES: ATP-binding protein [Rhodococcus]MDA3635379.1 ATP-binding protein [Rhodococcus sp. C-2]UPU46725.1 ATP-binding protein [Rhodococcus qingshengii JCM 15477]